MTKSRKTHQPSCQLYLVAQAIPGEATLARLGAALEVAKIAVVLFTPPETECTENGAEAGDAGAGAGAGARFADTLKPLIALAQAHDAAALVLNDVGLVKSLKADGIHLSAPRPATDKGGDGIDDIRAALHNNYILGATSEPLRDDAMILGERGADYVGFALNPLLDEPSQARQDLLERVSWWAQIFEIPCVVFDAETTDQAQELAHAGADFVAITLAPGTSPAGAAELVRTMAKAIDTVRVID